MATEKLKILLDLLENFLLGVFVVVENFKENQLKMFKKDWQKI